MAYMPAVPDVDDSLLERLEETDLLLFDGTFWSDDELIRVQGSGSTRAKWGMFLCPVRKEACASWRDCGGLEKSLCT